MFPLPLAQHIPPFVAIGAEWFGVVLTIMVSVVLYGMVDTAVWFFKRARGRKKP